MTLRQTALTRFGQLCEAVDALPPADAEIAWKIVLTSLEEAALRMADVVKVLRRAEKVTTK